MLRTERAERPNTRRRQHIEDATLLRLLVDRVLDYAIFLLTPDGHIASWNVGAERLKGYTADEIIGQSSSARTAHASGPTSSSRRCSTTRARCAALPRSRAT